LFAGRFRQMLIRFFPKLLSTPKYKSFGYRPKDLYFGVEV